MWRTLLTNQLWNVGRKLALLVFSWNKWLIKNKPMLPRRLQRCWGRNQSSILVWSQSLKHTGIFLETRPTLGLPKRPKVEIFWDFLLISESLRRTMEKRQSDQWPQNLFGLKLPPRMEWPHVGLVLAVYLLVLWLQVYFSIPVSYRFLRPHPRELIQEDYTPQQAICGNHQHS